ncbi:MAG: class I SAM-dependent methyltransferase [Ruegeria sp.]
MTKLTDFLNGRGPAEMYEDCWVPCTLWPYAVDLAELTAPGDRVLDVGAGTGLLTELAAARIGRQGHVVALEPTPFMIDTLKPKFEGNRRITLASETIEMTHANNEEFDVVLCHQVIQYVAEPSVAFREMRRVLKPGGCLGVGVWSDAGDQVAGALQAGFENFLGESFAPIHAWSFGGLKRLCKLAESAEFSDVSLEKKVRTARFDSVEHLLAVHLAGGMRVNKDEVLMGMFDLSDPSFEPKVEALLQFLTDDLGKYETQEGLNIPWSSDVLVARA